MKTRLLYSKRTQIRDVKLISSSTSIITFAKKPNMIKSFLGTVKEKDFLIKQSLSVLRGPIKNILSVTGRIEDLKVNYLFKHTEYLKLKFNIEKSKYIYFDNIIYENVEDLYNRIVKLHTIVKKRLIDKGLIYVEDTYEINEEFFISILNKLESYKFINYSEITDKVIISEIVKHFRSA